MTNPSHRAVVLGSAQDGGVPQFGERSAPGSWRSASSIALLAATGERVLVDASPDLRLQYQALPDARPTGRADRVFDAVLLTHGHMGHYSGLVHFGKEAANTSGVPVFASAAMIDFLTHNEPWAALFRHGHLAPHPLQEDVEVVVIPGLTVTAHSVPHRPDFTDTFAFEFEAGSRSLLYLPDIDDWQAWPEAEAVIERVDVAMLDATFFTGDEHPGRDLAAIPHPPVTTTIERFAGFATSTRLVLTHLNWTNPLCDAASAESAVVRRAGFDVAYDGLEVPL